MSFSFGIKVPSKEEAKEEVSAKMAAIARQQVCHQQDMPHVIQAAHGLIDLLAEDESKAVVVAINGSLSGTWVGSDLAEIQTVNLNITAYLGKPD